MHHWSYGTILLLLFDLSISKHILTISPLPPPCIIFLLTSLPSLNPTSQFCPSESRFDGMLNKHIKSKSYVFIPAFVLISAIYDHSKSDDIG